VNESHWSYLVDQERKIVCELETIWDQHPIGLNGEDSAPPETGILMEQKEAIQKKKIATKKDIEKRLFQLQKFNDMVNHLKVRDHSAPSCGLFDEWTGGMGMVDGVSSTIQKSRAERLVRRSIKSLVEKGRNAEMALENAMESDAESMVAQVFRSHMEELWKAGDVLLDLLNEGSLQNAPQEWDAPVNPTAVKQAVMVALRRKKNGEDLEDALQRVQRQVDRLEGFATDFKSQWAEGYKKMKSFMVTRMLDGASAPPTEFKIAQRGSGQGLDVEGILKIMNGF